MSSAGRFETWLVAESIDTTTFPSRYLEAEVTIPAQNKATLRAAWDVHVELRTRITTQTLPFHSGQEKSALDSLYSVFDRTRNTLTKYGPNVGVVGQIIMAALNEDVRPLTAYWHGVLAGGALDQPDECGSFRADLLAVQHKLRVLTDFLGYVAQGQGYHPSRLVREPLQESPEPPQPSVKAHRFVPDELDKLEEASVQARRRKIVPRLPAAAPRAGLALSGGGIRSATFSLGVLTALSRAGLYRHFDYLSTVSGGGYTGTLISSWAAAKAANGGTDEELKKGPFDDETAIEYLRDRSRYLIEGGPAGVARALVPIALGIVASLATLLLTTLPALLLASAAAHLAHYGRTHTFGAALLGAGILGVLLIVTRWRRLRESLGGWIAQALVIGAALAAPGASIWLVDLAQGALRQLLSLGITNTVALLGVPALLTALGHTMKHRISLRGSAKLVLALSPWVAYAVGLWFLTSKLTVGPSGPLLFSDYAPDAVRIWLMALGVAFVVAALTDVNQSSPHGYYRDRLAETYCVTVDERGLSSLGKPLELAKLTDLAPIHLINATVNLPATKARNERGRASAPCMFSKHGLIYPAVSEAGWLEPGFVAAGNERAENVDLATAMAISGAAVSSRMGTSTPNGLSPWLTLLNLRLSYWLRNPGRAHLKWLAWPWAYYLLRELIGNVHERSIRINVSDGGHFENLGVYELIRRKCRFIVAVDGEADPELQCGGLINLVRLARIDFGAEIRIDVRNLRLDTARFSRTHLALGRIRYTDGSRGTLLYIKLSVTGDEPAHVLAYRELEPVFPHHSTADQVYSETQFESYRALGQHVGEHLFRPELVGEEIARVAKERGNEGVVLAEWITQIQVALERDETLLRPEQVDPALKHSASLQAQPRAPALAEAPRP